MPKKARPVATIDCETDPFLFGRIPEPFLWDYFDGSRHVTIPKTEDFIAFLESLPPTVCYAHNGGKFDYHMPGFLNALEPFSRITIINGRLAKFSIGEVEFRDSVNILPIALGAYKKEEIDYAKMESNVRDKHMDEITRYLHKDTEYLFELVHKFRTTYGDGLTLAGCAMKFWSNRTGIKPPQTTAGFYHDIARFYYGGRVECFQKGLIENVFKMVDINSAYPYAMLHQHPFSTNYVKTLPSHDPHDIAEIVPHSLYSIHGESFGCLPVRGERQNLGFPHTGGEKTTFYITGWEYLAGLRTGTIKIDRINFRYDFSECIDFTKYINYFYDLKKSAKKESAEYIFAKLFMNSLYGKFGANPENYANFEIIPLQYVEAAKACGSKFAGELGKWAIAETPLEQEQMRFYNVATAASITGFVRAYLWEHICKIKDEGGQVLYCDTDSIAFRGEGKGFRFDKELGGWSNEGEFESGGIAGKKMYAFKYKGEERYKSGCKGVRITPQQILKVCSGETVNYQRDAPSFGSRIKIDKDGRKVRTGCTRFVEREVKMT